MQKRKLGGLEATLAYNQDAFAGAANTTFTLHLKGQLDFELLKKAFHFLYQKHPILQASYVREQDDYFYQVNIEFSQVSITEEACDDLSESWVALYDRETDFTFKAGQPLWKAALIYDSVNNYSCLIITTHHVTTDGVTEIIITKELIDFYNRLQRNETVTVDTLPLPDCLENSYKNKISLAEFSKNIETAQGQYKHFQKIPHQGSAAATAAKMIPVTLEEAEVAQFVQRCKKHKAKVTATFVAAMLLAAKKHFQYPESCLSVVTAINNRPQCNDSIQDSVGLFVSGLETFFENDTTDLDLWQLAALYQEQYEASFPLLATLPYDFDPKLIQADLDDLRQCREKRVFQHGFGISNWCAVEFPESFAGTEFTGLYRGSNRVISIYPYFLHIATINKRLCGGFNYNEAAMPTTVMQAYVASFKELLLQ